jgi:hypothetical protein
MLWIEFGPVVFPAYRNATAGASIGAHPPRSKTPRMTTEEFNSWLTSQPVETAEDRRARREWLEKVMPLPRR